MAHGMATAAGAAARLLPSDRRRRRPHSNCGLRGCAALVALAAASWSWASACTGGCIMAFAMPAPRVRADRKAAAAAERKAATAREEEFLASLEQGIGRGVDGIVVADGVSRLKKWTPAERKRFINGDWRLHTSDPGDVLVQIGTGMHGLPFTEMRHFFINLRPEVKKMRTFEILSAGPMNGVTTVLEGTVKFKGDNMVFKYSGTVDKEGKQESQASSTRDKKVTLLALHAGPKALILRVLPTDERKGGMAIFERQDNVVKSLRKITGDKFAVLPGVR